MCENSRQRVIHISSAVAVIFLSLQVVGAVVGGYVNRRENIIALGNSGTRKTHVALGLGLAACQKGLSVGFITAAALVHELMESRFLLRR